MPVIERRGSGCGPQLTVRSRNSRSSSRLIPVATLAIAAVASVEAISRTSAAAFSGSPLSDELHLLRELAEPGLDRRAQLLDAFASAPDCRRSGA